MGNRLIDRRSDGYKRVDLFRLPRWAQLTIALAIVAVVVLVARVVNPHPMQPRWLPGAIHVGGYVYLGAAVVAIIQLLRRRR